MSSVYTPTAVVLGDITIPSDGDTFNASSINVPIQAVADGLRYEINRATAADANRIISTGYTRLASNFSTTSGTYVDVTGMSVTTASCVAGDKLIIDARMAVAGDVTFSYVRLLVNDGGGDIDPSEYATTVQTGHIHIPFAFVYTVANTGSVTVRAQLHTNGGGTSSVYGDAATNVGSSSIRVVQIRP